MIGPDIFGNDTYIVTSFPPKPVNTMPSMEFTGRVTKVVDKKRAPKGRSKYTRKKGKRK